ncbi:hypothetical protein [Rhizobium etli]|nr:hypothetical protein [Rhizobium etli]
MKPIICAEMKENQQILNDEFSELDSMVKSPVLEHTKDLTALPDGKA